MEAPVGVAGSRVRLLTPGVEDVKKAKCVLYWMNSAVRESYNHALETAAACATNRKLPLLAVYILDASFPDWSERHFRFAAEGLTDVREKLEKRGIPFAVLRAADAEQVGAIVADIAQNADAARVIADTPLPLHRTRAMMKEAVKRCEESGIPVVEVETNVVVPVEEVSEKEEFAARTIRPKVHRNWQGYFVRLPPAVVEYPAKKWPSDALSAHETWDLSIDSVPGMCRRATEVSKFFVGGYDSAMKYFEDFLENKLANYANGRNEPSSVYQSQLSPYLRYGHISPVEIAIRVRSRRGGTKNVREGMDSFLEELIVRRELAYNMCHYNENYDNLKVLPNFATETLRIHAKDKRPWNYSYEELECALTHCPYWNAAQIELVTTGKMQGYMRMYWAKKILEWVNSYEKAFEYAIRLNNVYNLDGSDPNSYAGVAWCFGKHDQGWREREIFGKIRYMNAAGLKRKFNMEAYIAKVKKLAQEHMPPEIAAIRSKSKKRAHQASLTEMVSNKKRRK